MKKTFLELGIPFPLYEAPVEASDDYAGDETCCICGTPDAPCFNLGIGTALIIPCPSCATDNGLNVRQQESAHCRECGVSIPFPQDVAARMEPKAC